MSPSFVETDLVLVDADLVATLVGRGGYTHPLFDVSAHGDQTPLPGQGVLLMAGGLVEQCGVLDDAVAMLEMKSVRFHRMVRAGDSLRVRVTPGEHRATSSGRHVQSFAWQVLAGTVPAGTVPAGTVPDSAETVAEVDVVMLMNTIVEGA